MTTDSELASRNFQAPRIRAMTDGDYRQEVKRAKKILKRLCQSADTEKAASAVSEILRMTQESAAELNRR